MFQFWVDIFLMRFIMVHYSCNVHHILNVILANQILSKQIDLQVWAIRGAEKMKIESCYFIDRLLMTKWLEHRVLFRSLYLPSWSVVMLKQRQLHLGLFTLQIMTAAFSEMNLSRWETYAMGLINVRNESFLSLKWFLWTGGINACPAQWVGICATQVFRLPSSKQL